MNCKHTILISLLFFTTGCDRGAGEEPTIVNHVDDNNLIGTWVLSKTHTNKKVLKWLDKDINEYFFKILPNNHLEYHSLDKAIGFSKPKFYSGKGAWELLNKTVFLKRAYTQTTYKDKKGIFYSDKQSPSIKKPITAHTYSGLSRLYDLNITNKNNKLLLWYYDGDFDARRYIMYEKAN